MIFSPLPRMMGDVKPFLALLLIFPFLCRAESFAPVTRYYHYDGKPIFLGSGSFRRYIIPQLKNILRDYERLLVKIDSSHKDLIAIQKKGDELLRAWKKTGFSCRNQFSRECIQGYRKTYTLGRKVDLLGLNSWTKQTNVRSFDKRVGEGRRMALFIDVGEILRANYLMLHYLEEGWLFGDIEQNLHSKLIRKIEPLIKDIRFFSNNAMTGFLSEQEKKMFDFVWYKFFSPLNTYVINERDKEYLLRHLEDLNIAWHTFHMRMTKGVRKYPSHIEIMFTIMSKRWNSILKIILQTRGKGRR